MSLPDSIVVNVHIDPGHAYFEVPSNLISELGVCVSRFSFISPDNSLYYLECDRDAEQFINALAQHNIGFKFEEIEYEEPAFFRKYRTAGLLH